METKKQSLVDQYMATIENPEGFTMEPLPFKSLDYLSPAKIKELAQSPKHFKWRYIDGNKRPDTASLKFGRIVHWAILNSKEFTERYVIQPEFKGTGSRKAKQEWLDGLPNESVVLKTEEVDKILEMINSIHSHPIASKLLSYGTPEVCMYANLGEEYGNQWFSRPDFLRNDNMIIELKTTKDASAAGFARDIANYHYNVQVHMYGRMLQKITGQAKGVAFIAVEKTPPYCVAVYEMDEHANDHTAYFVRMMVDRYKECMKVNRWPDYSESVQYIGLPKYAVYNNEAEAEKDLWEV